MRRKGRWAEKETERGVGVHIRKKIESLMIQGTREEDEVMGDTGTEGIRTDMMIERGEAEGETITDGDENKRLVSGADGAFRSVVFIFTSSQRRPSNIKTEPLSSHLYCLLLIHSKCEVVAAHFLHQRLHKNNPSGKCKQQESQYLATSKGNRTRHCLLPANHNTCSLVPSLLHSFIHSFLIPLHSHEFPRQERI
jgi:hypothetical protein